MIWVSLSTRNDGAGEPAKLTAAAPVKFVPVRTTGVPVEKLFGDRLVMFGLGGVTPAVKKPIDEIDVEYWAMSKDM